MEEETLFLLAIFAGLAATSMGLFLGAWIKLGSRREDPPEIVSRRFLLSTLLAVGGLMLAFYALTKYQINAARTALDYEVLSALFERYPENPSEDGGLLIWHESASNFRVELDARTLREKMTALEAETFASFLARNRTPAPLQKQFDIPQSYMLLGEEDALKIRQQDEAFEGLSKLGWLGVYATSLPGFNASNTQALVYLEIICGDGCGGGDLVLLARVDGGWRRIGFLSLWAS